MGNSIAITGANGFLGKNICYELYNRGYEVKPIVRSERAARQLVSYLGSIGITNNWVQVEVVPQYDSHKLKEILGQARVLIHVIGITRGPEEQFYKINYSLAKSIIDSAWEAGVQRIILPTGLGVSEYGNPDKLWANNPYFGSKWKLERYLDDSSIPYIVFRPSYILGPEDELIPWIIAQILKGTVSIPAPGTTPIQPIYVRDVAKIFTAAATTNTPIRKKYDLVGPKVLTMKDVVQLVRTKMEMLLDKSFPITLQLLDRDRALSELDISPEELDVSHCDLIGDNSELLKDFDIKLIQPEDAIEQTVHFHLRDLGLISD